MVLGDLDSYMQKKKKSKLNQQVTPYTKKKFKVDKNLKIRCDTKNVLEKNIGRKISDIPHSNIFTNISPRARDIKERINKWDLIKIKSFCTAKEIISRMKRVQTVWKIYLQMIPWTRV